MSETKITIREHHPHSDIAKRLIAQLDADLAGHYPDDQATYASHNLLDPDVLFFVLYVNDAPMACGAYRPKPSATIEVKRMYVAPAGRGNGYSKQILAHIEAHAVAAGFERAVLETGIHQAAALHLYPSAGYRPTPCYEPYTDMPDSRCFEKALTE